MAGRRPPRTHLVVARRHRPIVRGVGLPQEHPERPDDPLDAQQIVPVRRHVIAATLMGARLHGRVGIPDRSGAAAAERNLTLLAALEF